LGRGDDAVLEWRSFPANHRRWRAFVSKSRAKLEVRRVRAISV
jgi:hypothetical protein